MKLFSSGSGNELDRLLSGMAPAESGLDDVARMLDSVKSAYLTEPEPELQTAHLAGLMKTVHLTEKGDLVARPASKAHGPGFQVSGLPTRRRRIMLETLLGSIAAKIAAGGIAVALASTGAAAATGNLPDQVQTGVSRAVDNVGIHIPLGETAAEQDELNADVEGDVETELDSEGEAGIDAGIGADVNEQTDGDVTEEGSAPNENAEFGQGVATDARDGGVDGQDVGGQAREMAEERKATGQAHRPEGTPDNGSDEDSEEGAPQGQGMEQANNTPAASFLPDQVPGGGEPADDAGPGAGADRRPAGTPGGRP